MDDAGVQLLVEIIGWIGSAAILMAYGLNSYQKISSGSILFALLNLVGGGMLIVYSVYKEAFANTFINGVWVIIAMISMVRYFSNSKKATP